MKIYLVRHGDYFLDPTKHVDVLSERGEKEISALANFLGKINLKVTNIFHSEKNRARQTAEILAQKVISKEPTQVRKGLAPNDAVDDFVDEIIHWDQDALIVGHLPFMGRLVSLLVTGKVTKEIVEFQTGTIVCLEQIENVHWTIRWVLAAELLL